MPRGEFLPEYGQTPDGRPLKPLPPAPVIQPDGSVEFPKATDGAESGEEAPQASTPQDAIRMLVAAVEGLKAVIDKERTDAPTQADTADRPGEPAEAEAAREVGEVATSGVADGDVAKAGGAGNLRVDAERPGASPDDQVERAPSGQAGTATSSSGGEDRAVAQAINSLGGSLDRLVRLNEQQLGALTVIESNTENGGEVVLG